MKSITKKNIFFTAILLITTLICSEIFAYTSIIRAKEKKIGPGEDPLMLVGVTGDSYGGYLINNLMRQGDFDLKNYCVAGSTINQNKNRILDCIQDRYKFIVISIGVNDHYEQTPLNEFFETINLFCEAAKSLDKYVIFHTYMTYPTSPLYNFTYTCEQYDSILRGVANIHKDNVIYIDMSDVNATMYHQEDCIHYNDNFYEVLISRLIPVIYGTLNKNETETY